MACIEIEPGTSPARPMPGVWHCDIVASSMRPANNVSARNNYRKKDLLPPRPAGSPPTAEPSTSAICVPYGPIGAVYAEVACAWFIPPSLPVLSGLVTVTEVVNVVADEDGELPGQLPSPCSACPPGGGIVGAVYPAPAFAPCPTD